MTLDPKHLFILPESTIREAIACIDRNARGITLVIDEDERLLGTLTDGDVRRAILAGLGLNTPVSILLNSKANSLYPEPVYASPDTDRGALLQLMQERRVRQIPILDPEKRVLGLVTIDELLPNEVLSVQALVMAGGIGMRMLPKTENLPKPMLPVGDRPLMEDIIRQLRQVGIKRVNIATHYKSDKITEYFGDGQAFGIDLKYVTEDSPLGTAGAVGLLEHAQEPLLVINGDILTRVDFRAMFDFHREQQADLTVGVRQYDLQVPYGVIECNGIHVQRLLEKPLLNFLVNAGIYMLSPAVHSYIHSGQRFDMTDLIQELIREKKSVVSFPIWEYWLDIGQVADYEKAQADMKNGRLGS